MKTYKAKTSQLFSLTVPSFLKWVLEMMLNSKFWTNLNKEMKLKLCFHNKRKIMEDMLCRSNLLFFLWDTCMTCLQRKTKQTQVLPKILIQFWELFHLTLISCSRKQWCSVNCTKWANLQRKLLLKTSLQSYSLVRMFSKVAGLTKIISNNFHISMRPQAKDWRDVLMEKHFINIAPWKKKNV